MKTVIQNEFNPSYIISKSIKIFWQSCDRCFHILYTYILSLQLMLFPGPFKISASASRRWRWHRHWHCKKIILYCKVFVFAFRSFIWIKHPWWSTFQVHLLTFLGVSDDVQSSYSVGNPLTPASEKRNSTVDVISGALKTRKA